MYNQGGRKKGMPSNKGKESSDTEVAGATDSKDASVLAAGLFGSGKDVTAQKGKADQASKSVDIGGGVKVATSFINDMVQQYQGQKLTHDIVINILRQAQPYEEEQDQEQPGKTNAAGSSATPGAGAQETAGSFGGNLPNMGGM